ncbi:MAG: hypothetical protein V7727_20480, partial [Sneathiella sp.]
MPNIFEKLPFAVAFSVVTATQGAWAQEKPIVHDAEFILLKNQHADNWMKEDADVATRLAEIREKNGGAPPNIIY